MSEPRSWRGIAFNFASESENRIHSDEVAKRFGFRGGLVPGVSVHAYLVHPAVEAWGLAWLGRGAAGVALKRPLYDRDAFRVEVKADGARAYRGEVVDPEGELCAEGRVSLPEAPPGDAPARRGDPPAPERGARPEATRAALEALRERGVGSVRIRWPAEGEPDRYVRDLDALPEPIRPGFGGFANPAFALGLANRVLTENLRLGPWIHAESRVQNHAPIAWGSALVVEARVAELFARGGHEFVDLEVAAFLEPDAPAMTAHHRAIYRLRGS